MSTEETTAPDDGHAPVYEDDTLRKRPFINKPLLIAFILVALVGLGVAAYRIVTTPPKFVGEWQRNGNPSELTYMFNKDKTGSITQGEDSITISWDASGNVIHIVPTDGDNVLKIVEHDAEWSISKPETSNFDMLTLVIDGEKGDYLPARDALVIQMAGGGGGGGAAGLTD